MKVLATIFIWIFWSGCLLESKADSLRIFKMFKPDVSLKKSLNERDTSGKKLQDVISGYYARYITHEAKRARFRLANRSKKVKIVELNNPSISINRHRFLTEADRLNGIDGVFFVNFGASSKRQTQFGSMKFGEWKPGGFSVHELNLQVKRKNGVWSIQRMQNLNKLLPSTGKTQFSKSGSNANELPPGMSRIKK